MIYIYIHDIYSLEGPSVFEYTGGPEDEVKHRIWFLILPGFILLGSILFLAVDWTGKVKKYCLVCDI